MKLAVVILAAGLGKRMKSKVPKVLHSVLGRPMIAYVLDAVRKISSDSVVVVVGHGAEDVKKIIGLEGISYVEQERQLGTGHAANCASGILSGFIGNVLILNGDYPLITSKSIKKFISEHEKSGSGVSVLTSVVENPTGYGRVVRDGLGDVERIVEERDATSEERKITEINSGAYCAKSSFLWDALSGISSRNKQKEYYLTDIIEIASNNGRKVSGILASDSDEMLGVNDRIQLSVIEAILKKRTNDALMRSGVTMVDPSSTYISPGVNIGADTTIYPHTYIYGDSRIGKGSTIGPSVWIEDSKLGDGAVVKSSCYITQSVIKKDVTIGPFTHVRPQARIMDGAKIGNFVEIKKSSVGAGSKVPHLSYVGDAKLGKNVNVGAGTITCNYDGYDKYETIIGDGAFIGSDTMLVAPIRLGRGATTGAGSTITKDVPEGGLAIGRARQKIIENWRAKPRRKD